MSKAFPRTEYSDILDKRAEDREIRRRRIDAARTLDEYHEQKYPADADQRKGNL